MEIITLENFMILYPTADNDQLAQSRLSLMIQHESQNMLRKMGRDYLVQTSGISLYTDVGTRSNRRLYLDWPINSVTSIQYFYPDTTTDIDSDNYIIFERYIQHDVEWVAGNNNIYVQGLNCGWVQASIPSDLQTVCFNRVVRRLERTGKNALLSFSSGENSASFLEQEWTDDELQILRHYSTGPPVNI